MDNVQVFYKGEYTLKSPYMEFDFKQGLTTTKDVVDIKGKKIDMKGHWPSGKYQRGDRKDPVGCGRDHHDRKGKI